MKLIFWQNCVSPHQLAYIKELKRDKRVSKVYLVAPVWDLTQRKNMGWSCDSSVTELDIIISPDDEAIENLLKENQENSIHLFSGIRADKFVFRCFKKSLLYKLKRGIITERPNLYKKPLFLHKVRFLIFDFKYVSKIDFVFGMGDDAVDYYKFWSKRWKVFPFAYCVASLSKSVSEKNDIKLRFVYVGSLIKLKNVLIILKSIRSLSNNVNLSLDIIGSGPESVGLYDYVYSQNLSGRIKFVGKLSMQEVHKRLTDYDVLMLPSLYDGWGAVVNEGLQSGLYIITSDKCGAKTLVEGSNRGAIFKSGNVDSLSIVIKQAIVNANDIKERKESTIEWSKKIRGISLAKYMLDCLSYSETVIPPWKK